MNLNTTIYPCLGRQGQQKHVQCKIAFSTIWRKLVQNFFLITMHNLGELTYSTKHYLPLGLWVAPSHARILDHRLSEAIASTCREISDKVHYTRVVVVVHTTWPSINKLCYALQDMQSLKFLLCNPCLPISWKGLFLIKSMKFSCNFRI
jgi:hypothetical protein